MLEEILIRYSAPTLAGLKTANLFWYSWESKAEFENSMEVWTRIFEEKGLLSYRKSRYLCSLFRYQ